MKSIWTSIEKQFGWFDYIVGPFGFDSQKCLGVWLVAKSGEAVALKSCREALHFHPCRLQIIVYKTKESMIYFMLTSIANYVWNDTVQLYVAYVFSGMTRGATFLVPLIIKYKKPLTHINLAQKYILREVITSSCSGPWFQWMSVLRIYNIAFHVTLISLRT